MITFVTTSCGRLDLLKRSMDSFLKYNKYPIKEYIIIDDSGIKEIHNEIRTMFPDFTLLFNKENVGLYKSLDNAYSHVKTPYIFHCQDDWEFFNGGFIEKSLNILKSDSNILQVWLWNQSGHPVNPKRYYVDDVEFQIVGEDNRDVNHPWYGFSLMPGLRRLSDYKKIAPFEQYRKKDDFPALTEWRIGTIYKDYKVAIIDGNYCDNIGARRKNIHR